MSYAGTLNFGFTGARDTLPHLQHLAIFMGEAFEELDRILLGGKAKGQTAGIVRRVGKARLVGRVGQTAGIVGRVGQAAGIVRRIGQTAGIVEQTARIRRRVGQTRPADRETLTHLAGVAPPAATEPGPRSARQGSRGPVRGGR